MITFQDPHDPAEMSYKTNGLFVFYLTISIKELISILFLIIKCIIHLALERAHPSPGLVNFGIPCRLVWILLIL